MLSSDLVPLLGQRDSGPSVRFRQGVVITWDTSTGANVVDVGGTQLSDVPILNTGEAIALKAGHIVGLLGFGSSYWILGRITVPGDAQFASASVAFGSHGSSVTNFALSTTPTQKTGGTITVPTWADEALVMASTNATVLNQTAGWLGLAIQATIDAVGGGGAGTHIAPDDTQGTAAASAIRTITGPGATIAVGSNVWSVGGAMVANALHTVNLDVICVFRSTV